MSYSGRWLIGLIALVLHGTVAVGLESKGTAGTGHSAGQVLSPKQFKLPIRLGYQAAADAPKVVKRLFCYCGCDYTDKHTSLLDCFTSIHGAYCAICQEEAIEAAKLKKQGAPISKIQAQIDRHYARRYPFSRPSARLLEYRRQLKGSLVPLGMMAAGVNGTNHGCCH